MAVWRIFRIFLCKLIHLEKKVSINDTYHYHCPECLNIIQQKRFFTVHLGGHYEQTDINKKFIPSRTTMKEVLTQGNFGEIDTAKNEIMPI